METLERTSHQELVRAIAAGKALTYKSMMLSQLLKGAGGLFSEAELRNIAVKNETPEFCALVDSFLTTRREIGAQFRQRQVQARRELESLVFNAATELAVHWVESKAYPGYARCTYLTERSNTVTLTVLGFDSVCVDADGRITHGMLNASADDNGGTSSYSFIVHQDKTIMLLDDIGY